MKSFIEADQIDSLRACFIHGELHRKCLLTRTLVGRSRDLNHPWEMT